MVAEGVEGLLKREWAGARESAVTGEDAEEFTRKLEAGDFRQARDAQKWIARRTSKKLTESGVRKLMHRLGGKLKVPRKSHRKKDQAASDAFRAEFPERLTEVVGPVPDKPVRLWVLDEHRYGLLPVIRRVWSRRGVRGPRALCHHLQVGLPARGIGNRRRARRATALHPRYQSGHPRDFPAADRRKTIRTRCMWSSWIKPDFICGRATGGCQPTYGCCRCRLIVRSSTRWKDSAACSSHQRPNRLYRNLKRLEDHLIAVAKGWITPDKVHSMIHGWMRDQANAGAPN